MIQIYEAENKRTLLECKDRKLYENQVNIWKLNIKKKKKILDKKNWIWWNFWHWD